MKKLLKVSLKNNFLFFINFIISINVSSLHCDKMIYEKLFYWKTDEGIRFSKTKFFSILIFFYILISRVYYTHDLLIACLIAIITSIIAFIIGLIIHKSIKNDSIGSYGLINDIKHLFLYWEDSNEFVLSKTKIISIALYLISLVIYCIYYGFTDIFAGLGVNLFIAAPVCLVGYFIHINKNENPKNEPIKEKPQKDKNEEDTISNKSDVAEFNKYNSQISNLKNEFSIKDKKARELVAKTFQPPQITYDKFISYLDKCTKLFNDQINVIETIINLATKDSIELDNEIEERINISKSIIDKIDLLNNELALNIGKSKSNDEDINNLFEEMEGLIDSVKKYDLN